MRPSAQALTNQSWSVLPQGRGAVEVRDGGELEAGRRSEGPERLAKRPGLVADIAAERQRDPRASVVLWGRQRRRRRSLEGPEDFERHAVFDDVMHPQN